MNLGHSLFAQLMDGGNYRVRSFSCWDQFLCMAFAQLTFRESLGDIVACLRSQQRRLYHLGIRGTVSRSALADANERSRKRRSSKPFRSMPCDLWRLNLITNCVY